MTLTLTKNDKGFDINFTVTDSAGNAIDLTGITVKFQLATQETFIQKLNGTCTLVNPTQGTCKYTVANEDLNIAAGSYWGALQLDYGDDKIITSQRFAVTINEDLGL